MAAPRSANGGMLTSWKEISAFFNRDVRTVQRWEREEGLPVHRHRHQRQNSVFAYPAELDAWWQQRQQTPATETDSGAPMLPRVVLTRRSAKGTVIALGGLLLAIGGLAWQRSSESAPATFPMRLVTADGPTDGLGLRTLHDINGDGRDDVAVTLERARELRIHFGTSTEEQPAPVLHITANQPGSVAGGWVGDVNGDGIGDIAVTVYFDEPASFHGTGPTYLLLGRRRWPARVELPWGADATLAAAANSDLRLGPCLSPTPLDLDGDGLDDLVFGAPDFSPPGRASGGGIFVLRGRRLWPAGLDVVAAADVTIYGSRTGEGLAGPCAAGDFNGDGRTDLAVAAREGQLWNLLGSRGRYYVFAGRAAWSGLLDAGRDALLRVDGASTASAGITAPVLSDLNGDGRADLVTATPRTAATPHGRGMVAIFFGDSSSRAVRVQQEPDALILGSTADAGFGQAVAAADVNADDRSDLIVSEPGTRRLLLVSGRTVWPARSAVAALDPLVLQGIGNDRRVIAAAAGDFDGDDAVDIALLASGTATAGLVVGVIAPYAPIGIDVRPDATPNVILTAPGSVAAIGISSRRTAQLDELDPGSFRFGGLHPVRQIWRDFDGDGRADLLLYFDPQPLRRRPGIQQLALVGRTRRGVPVAGADRVQIVAGGK